MSPTKTASSRRCGLQSAYAQKGRSARSSALMRARNICGHPGTLVAQRRERDVRDREGLGERASERRCIDDHLLIMTANDSC
jgi:hypothetical protein